MHSKFENEECFLMNMKYMLNNQPHECFFNKVTNLVSLDMIDGKMIADDEMMKPRNDTTGDVKNWD